MQGLHEPMPVADTFCSGLGEVENVGGGCLRFYMYVLQQPPGGGEPEKIVVAKIIMPLSAVPDAIVKTILAVGGATLKLPARLAETLVH